MDYFYDGQIRRYVTQFMRVFIGFQWKAGDGTLSTVPVMYGDMTRQVASIIKENSENKMPNVPRIACYISGLEMDTNRLSDSTFVSKVHIRERRFTDAGGTREYQNVQGGNYTVERLMPTPFKMSMKCDIWTSNTDQKLQLMEQILVLFNPSLELQTTDNYIDWTSLSSLYLSSTNFSSRTIPAGAETEIDVCTLEFELPIWLTPPAKVKKLGIVQSVIANAFMETGDIVGLEDIIYNSSSLNRRKGTFETTTNRYRVLLFKSNTGNQNDRQYDVTLVNPQAAVLSLGLDQKDYKNGEPIDWNTILEVQGGYKAGSELWFKQASGYELIGQFVINPLDPSILVVTLDPDTYPRNTSIDNNSRIYGFNSDGTVYTEEGYSVSTAKDYVDAIIDPYKYNPITTYGGYQNIPLGLRFLMLDDVNNSPNRGGYIEYPSTPSDSTSIPYRGPQAWRDPSNEDSSWSNQDGTDPVIRANSIIEWNGRGWVEVFNPTKSYPITVYIQNYRTGIKYKWDGEQWLKAFEGEYAPGDWNFRLA